MSTSVSVSPGHKTEEKETPVLAKMVRKMDTEKLLEFLEVSDLQLDGENLGILRQGKIAGKAFLRCPETIFVTLVLNGVQR